MATKPEVKVKKKVMEILKEHDVYAFYPVASGYGSAGVPDIVACCNGQFIGIECKAGSNKPNTLQTITLNKIRENKGVALVVNESNLDELSSVLFAIKALS